MKLRTVYIITELTLGGAQRSTLEIIRSLDKEKYDVTLISSDRGLLVDEARAIPQLRIIMLASLRRQIHPWFDALAFFQLCGMLRRLQPHIVHTHSSKAGILGRWAAFCVGVKVRIHTVHGWSFHRFQNKVVHSLYVFAEKITAAITTKLLVVTDCDRAYGLQKGIGSESRYALVRYGIRWHDFVRSDQAAVRRDKNIPMDSFLVGMVACLKPQKNPLQFVRIAAQLRSKLGDVRFVLAGDGQLRPALLAAIRYYGLEDVFHFLGWQRNNAEIISGVDALVLTSLWEGFPLVLLEAMAAGKPIVAPRINGIPELIHEEEQGFLVEPLDTDAFVERVMRLHKSHKHKKSEGSLDRKKDFEKFDYRRMCRETQSIYESLFMLRTKEKSCN